MPTISSFLHVISASIALKAQVPEPAWKVHGIQEFPCQEIQTFMLARVLVSRPQYRARLEDVSGEMHTWFYTLPLKPTKPEQGSEWLTYPLQNPMVAKS